ncbi:uncharacterized protein B0H64DRAFT_450543 [Chaetomium fimeti]|uniref:Uncharacterized protein n=1 Tax=Chaetomium fimeti TaxID=1854472 RepID=A0AAE0LN02_9PEZI|nr:hypothetical protein B0H64DRAFT_450543 [Chaetomium fimeti]
MTKPITILLALAATVLPLAEAKACKEGLKYCGSTLLRRGDYLDEIRNELERVGIPPREGFVWNSLFDCGGNGWIGWQAYCGTCIDGGDGKDDYCKFDVPWYGA